MSNHKVFALAGWNVWSRPAEPSVVFKTWTNPWSVLLRQQSSEGKRILAQGRLETQPLLSLLCLATSHRHLNPTIHQHSTMTPPQLPPAPPPPNYTTNLFLLWSHIHHSFCGFCLFMIIFHNKYHLQFLSWFFCSFDWEYGLVRADAVWRQRL